MLDEIILSTGLLWIIQKFSEGEDAGFRCDRLIPGIDEPSGNLQIDVMFQRVVD